LLVAGGLMVNVDLIYGLPGQTESSFARDCQTVASHGVHSVTMYNLRLNEKTPVAGALDDDERLGLEQLVKWRAHIGALAAEMGFQQTRWHTFVRRPREAQAPDPSARLKDISPNGNQFSAGMSAVSRLGSTCYRNHLDFNSYLTRIEDGRSPVEEVFILREDDHKALFIGQSLGSGKSLVREDYRHEFGDALEQDFGPVLRRLREGGLIDETVESISLSPTGKLVFDLVNWMFYPERAREWIADRQLVELRPRKHKLTRPAVADATR
jgi:oxygen-independent coproporphyrinogen-3 oxidase